ncbi:cell wall-binding repeat-containing protein [Leifsonia sp. ZF2019]|uniref:cell wall-binding repeat-containing protein n=1 Tax=Leifsonia sp. ZF2019 TaxID=2781978 RepID=UPI001CBDC4F0|nr:cell wall-binding repeat-containing protein [Leifsonia sp. ZF2019]UAJ80014.1 cell wall-binding repeat-containing protein [Leifsonia sp. ZF2019]
MRVSRRIVVSVVAGAAVAAAIAAPVMPAAAFDIKPPAVVGYIDSISVGYVQSSPKPTLHVKGWAGDLNDGWQNGTGTAAIELVATPAGGSPTTIGWAEREDFNVARPDVRRAYPQLGPNQGFDVRWASAPSVGPLTVCARMWNLNAAMPPGGSVQVGCASVTVPAARPSYAKAPTSATVGSPIQVDPGQTGGTDSFSWLRWNSDAPDPSGYAQPIAGANSATYTPTVKDIGATLQAIVTTRAAGRATIEQQTDDIFVQYPDHRVTVTSGADRFDSSIAISRAAFPDATAGAPVAYLASGVDFPDALSAGPAAAAGHGTLLLTMPGTLDPRIAAELTRLHPPRIVVVGGPAVVADGVLDSLRALPFAPEVTRVFGSDRYETSRAVVQTAFGASVPRVYLATGRGFADALSAGAAAAVMGVPVVLTDGSLARADEATRSALASWNTTSVSIAGGRTSVTDGVAGSLGTGIDVTRLAGGDRFETAAAIAASIPASRTAFLASGYGFPDALGVSVLASSLRGPLLLTTGRCIPVSELQFMFDRGVDDFQIVGGENVQTTEVRWARPC